MVAINQNVVKGTGVTKLTSLNPLSNGNIIILPNATALTFNPNITLSEVRVNTPTGVSVKARDIETAANPELTLTLPLTPIAMQMVFNSEWESVVDADFDVTQSFLPTTNTISAKASGFYGYGVAEDATATFGYADPTDPTASVQLTQVTYATFNPAVTNNSFAVGANAEIKISDNIVAKAPLITGSITNTATIRQLGENTFDTFKVDAVLLFVDNSIAIVTFPAVQIKADARVFDPSTGVAEFTMSVLNDGSTCTYNPTVKYLTQDQIMAC
jgi:hypothetical protein